MAADNYKEVLQEVCNKLNNIDTIKEADILNIKNSVESIEGLITDTQAKLNFLDIKEKLENIAMQVDNCNSDVLKDLFQDINSIKESANNAGKYLENIQNQQNLTMTSAEFEEYQKQQLDLALKTNENIFNELSAIKENINFTPNGENIKNITEQLSGIHQKLTEYIENLANQLPEVPTLDEIGAIMSDLTSVHQKNIKQTNQLVKDLQSKFDNFEEEFNNKNFENQIAKISEIYDSLNMISVWVDKVGFINQSIENVYARLGENIDFDEVSEKVDIIYENITALNNWSMKIDNIDNSMEEIQSKITSLGEFQEVASGITTAINNIKDRLDSMSIENLDFEDITNKIDLIYENIGLLNDWVGKIDDIVSKSKELDSKFQTITEDITSKLKEVNENFNLNYQDLKFDFNEFNDDITEKLLKTTKNINTNFDNISKDINSQLHETTENINTNFEEIKQDINSKLDESTENISTNFEEIKQDINSKLYKSTENISTNFEEIKQDINSKLDKSTENISTNFEEIKQDINSKLDSSTENINTSLDEIKRDINTQLESSSLNADSKFDEISQLVYNNIDKTEKMSQNLPDIKSILESLSGDLKSIINSTESEDEDSYIYTLRDIESDFSVLNKSLLDNRQSTSEDINSLKECFTALNEDISSISMRTNKLILSADDANKEFKIYLDSFKSVIQNLKEQGNDGQNLSSRFDVLCGNVAEMIKLLNKSVNANNNLNTAFTYLAEWIDATGNVLNNIQNDILEIKSEKTEIAKTEQKEKSITADDNSSLNENISELKSLLTGIIVQLNTALTPDIDSLNERIDKLCDENDTKLSQLEKILQDKVNQQEKQITALEEKLDKMCEKFDRLVEVMADDSHNYEMKDILNFIASQINTNAVNIQNSNNTINEVAQKLDSFDANINKIVNYIEED